MEPIAQIARQYDAELEEIRDHVLRMGALVERQIVDAVHALVKGDPALAEEVIKNDYRVNKLDVVIDEECGRVITGHQPSEGDLRLVMAVIKITSDLERSGDEAEKIARMAIRLASQERPAEGHLEIYTLGEHVRQMLHAALEAFARLGTDAALGAARQDREGEKGYRAVVRQKITFMLGDPRTITRSLDLIWAARALERISDYACSINEHMIYLVKGSEVRHAGLEEAEQS